MKIKFGIIVFPGSNCDHDAYYSLKKIMGFEAEFLWHKDTDLKSADVIILPGGFSYGDYLRTGAIAKFSPIMNKVIDFSENGGLVMGICNGFQILLETGLLPGIMLRNKSLKFICKDVKLSVDNKETIFTNSIDKRIINVPIAHGDGKYYINENGLQELIKYNQVVFRYCSFNGKTDEVANINGSVDNIAGIINRKGNILGMMPHPERCCDPTLGKTDGQMIFNSIVRSFINTR